MGRTGEKGDCVMPGHTLGLFRGSLQHHLLATSPEVALTRPGHSSAGWWGIWGLAAYEMQSRWGSAQLIGLG
eukprot:450972-Rhodomonas_salina.1